MKSVWTHGCRGDGRRGRADTRVRPYDMGCEGLVGGGAPNHPPRLAWGTGRGAAWSRPHRRATVSSRA